MMGAGGARLCDCPSRSKRICSATVPNMKTFHDVSRRATLGRSLSLVVALVLGFTLHTTVAADKTPVPVTVAFEKAAGDDGPYVMTVTNSSSDALTVQISVHQSVKSHNRPMNVNHPEETIAAGGSTNVKGLAAHDKVKITSKGHTEVEIVVPGSE
jgi:hypothetical protein